MKKPQQNRPDYFPDKWIFIIAIPFISAFNYHLTYSDIHFNRFLLLTYSIDTSQGYIAWLAVRSIIFKMDKRLPFAANPLKRILLQLIITTAAGLTLIAMTTELVSWIVKSRPAPLNFYTIDLLIISIWFLVINGVYLGLFFYHQWEFAERTSKKIKSEGGLSVKIGNQNILVRFDDILLFCIDSEYVQIIHKNNKKYYLDQSLDQVAQKLPGHDFFRLNRQIILNRQVISGFKRIENGKLAVTLNVHMELSSDLIVSRTKAPEFKGWFLPQ